MLQKIHIKNVALIDELEIDFDPNFNVLSGETGAGKSIIVDSLFLLLGFKYDQTLLKFGTSSGFVEGIFDVNDLCKETMLELGFEESSTVLIRRKFASNGKNEIKINGQNATQNMLKSIASTLVEISGQNQHLNLNKRSEQLTFLDQFLPRDVRYLLENISKKYQDYKDTLRQIKELGDSSQRLRELEILKFQIDEIEKAQVKQNEEQEILNRRKLLLNFEKSKDSLTKLVSLLDFSEHSVVGMLNQARSLLVALKTLPDFDSLCLRFDDSRSELVDVCAILQDKMQELDFDQRELDELEKRLATVRNIKRKYGEYPQCQEFANNAKERFETLSDADNLTSKLQDKLQRCIDCLYEDCATLSAFRRQAAKTLSDLLVAELNELGMIGSVFEIQFDDLPPRLESQSKFSNCGLDSVEFYLSTNVGQPIKPLSKVASGGEMSRFMLCIKAIASDLECIDTLIFDEIDTGISGIIGQAVARKLAKISRYKQVLCISHLPQIASMADANFLISKITTDMDTVTTVEHIKDERLLNEIARLTGGINISKQSLSTAQEMVQWCKQYKQSLT